MSAKAISTSGGKAPWTLLASPLKARSVTEPVLKLETKEDDMDLSSDFKKLALQDREPLLAGKGGGKMRGTAKSGMDLPPTLKLLPPSNFRIQYGCTSSGGYSTSVGQLLLCAGGVATTTTNVASFWSAVRLKQVKVWPSVAASGSQDTYPSIDWVGADNNIPDQDTVQVIPGGLAVTRSLTFKPPAKSFASFWWTGSASTTNLFELYNIRVGDVIQVEFEVTPTIRLSNVAKTVSGATAGDVYYASLDGAGDLPPRGLITVSGL